MGNSYKLFVSFIFCIFVAGCAVKPQHPVSFKQTFWDPTDKTVGIIVTNIPQPDVYLPGASCLLCLAVAEANHSSLSKHVDTLTTEEVASLDKTLLELLEQKGFKTKLIEEPVIIEKLPKFKSDLPNTARKNYQELGAKHQVSHFLIVNVNSLGMQRTYSSYIPTSDPKAFFSGSSYMVNAKTNVYEWYQPITIFRGVKDKWDEPPHFPALTNAYYQAMAQGKERILTPFN